MNVQTFEPEVDPAQLAMNDIGQIKLLTSKPIIFDGYATNRLTGSFILIEPGTNATVAAGMLLPPIEPARPEYQDFAI
jgi:bifunctional enzyme CysN/CysC/sulfate adenylyltransferase subunit 1